MWVGMYQYHYKSSKRWDKLLPWNTLTNFPFVSLLRFIDVYCIRKILAGYLAQHCSVAEARASPHRRNASGRAPKMTKSSFPLIYYESGYPKRMVYMENSINIDDLTVPLFWETSICFQNICLLCSCASPGQTPAQISLDRVTREVCGKPGRCCRERTLWENPKSICGRCVHPKDVRNDYKCKPADTAAKWSPLNASLSLFCLHS